MYYDKVLARLDQLIEQGERVLATRSAPPAGVFTSAFVDAALFAEWQAGSLSFLERVFGDASTHYQLYRAECTHSRHPDAVAGQGVLKAAKTDVESGFLRRLDTLVAADIFSDFLDMAEHLLTEGYKDAAAVMIGSVLEEHLRKLCIANNIPVETVDARGTHPKKADLMNADLARVPVYSKLDLKNVTSWLDLRNKAAHGEYGEYTQQQVELLLQSVRDFITRNPA